MASSESPIHEVRVGAVSVMDWQARNRATTAARRQALFDLYIRRHDRINAWEPIEQLFGVTSLELG